MKRFLINFAIFLAALTSYGQQDLVLHQMSAVPQSMFVNPSNAPGNRLNIGIPMISSIYFRHQNTIFNPYHLFTNDGNSVTFRTQNYLDQIRKRNYIGFENDFELFSIGAIVGEKNYFSFGIQEKFDFRLDLPGDMLRFPFTGNASFDELENGTLDFSDFRITLSHYREFGFGWQRQINDKWKVGGKLKYLYGLENVDTKASSLKWHTNEDTWDWSFTGEMDVYSSGIWQLTDSLDENIDLEEEDISSYLLKRKNKGLGMDLGATYALNDKLELTGSVIDLGFISWKSYNKNFNSTNGEFAFTGVELTENIVTSGSSASDSLETSLEELQDDLESEFSYEEDESSYKTSLITRLYLGANYKLYENDRSSGTAGLLLHGELYKGVMRPTATISYSQRLKKWLSATAAYSVVDRDFRNLGLGLSLNAGAFQFYAVTDNVMAGVINKASFIDEGETSNDAEDAIMYPAFSRNMHVRTGFNLTLGRKPLDTDEDGVLDKNDECPETPGLVELRGCPDTDLDGIADLNDECPTEAGLSQFNGCPDTDEDGIQDKDDLCPNTPGLEKFGGCPDSDKDGIEDSKDDCPNISGLEVFNGCPDTDEDGIQDSEDECPEKVGTKEFNGCPDTDGDGLPDPKDKCPEEAGPLENTGCPWGDRDNDGIIDKEDACPSVEGPIENQGCPWEDLDGDGVLDKDDRCPKTPGPLDNEGCPVIEKEEQEVLNTAFDDLEFLSGKDVIKDESFESLEKLAELLTKKAEWKLEISGHTDNVGKESSNLSLSKKRSLAVADFMESRGISRERLVTKWYGESKPIADNSTNEGRQKNRRVEMEVIFE